VEQLAGPQHEVKSAASSRLLREQESEGAEPVWIWRRPWKTSGILERMSMNPPA